MRQETKIITYYKFNELSEEAIIETIEANEYEFDIEGSLIL